MTFDTYNPTKEDLIKHAPEGATHYSIEDGDYYFSWWKKDCEDNWLFKAYYRSVGDFLGRDWDVYNEDNLNRIEIPFMEVDDTDVNQGISDTLSDPISIRERILEIRKQREDGVTEEQELINQLASMGFQIIDEVNEKLHQLEETHDLQNPKNWRVGDMLERVNDEYPSVYTAGNLYQVKQEHPKLVVYDNFGGESSCMINEEDYHHFKFHSRPSK